MGPELKEEMEAEFLDLEKGPKLLLLVFEMCVLIFVGIEAVFLESKEAFLVLGLG